MKVLAIAMVVWLDSLRRKDAYVFLVLLGGLLVALGSVDMFGLGGTALYVLDIGLLFCWLFGWVLAINAGCRELPQEENRGTVYMLLAKPVSRLELLAGKWLGAWSGAATALLLFYLATALLAVARGAGFSVLVLAQAWLLHMVALAILVALGLVVSTRLNRDAATTLAGVLSAAAFLLVPQVPALLLERAPWAQTSLMAVYYVLPHLELFDIRSHVVHGRSGLDAGTFVLLIVYGLVCAGVLLLIAWLAYRQKRFDRAAATE
jgi:ABC-type transport system involved in multi-copper enzyme maturation permease subunit